MTLFSRTARIITLTFLLVMLLTFFTLLYFIMLPVGQRSADDLAALIELSSESWQKLPESERPAYVKNLYQKHQLQLLIEPLQTEEVPVSLYLPYFYFFEGALSKRLGMAVELHHIIGDMQYYWVDIPVKNNILHIGILRDRIQASPPTAFALVISITIIATLIASLLIARYLNAPLKALANASKEFGQGVMPKPLLVDGPKEIASVSQTFNTMVKQIDELQENRTVLLSGISHDLRTPLTRATLALEMLPENIDPTLVNPLREDMQEMNQLIGLFLEMSQGISSSERKNTDLNQLVNSCIDNIRRSGAIVRYQSIPNVELMISPLPLSRIINNLLENAFRYGNQTPIQVAIKKHYHVFQIDICDSGPGIPEDELQSVFRPFKRLEYSRNKHTGGSGLGLAIVNQLALTHGWTVKLYNQSNGGLCASIELPFN